jgi:SAM-dependent methyltransferase
MSGKIKTLERTAKEILRHLIRRFVARAKAADSEPPSRKERFSLIYRHGLWTDGDPAVPLSGGGSTLQATQTIRERLPELLQDLQCETLLDVGCGDFTWMSTVALPCRYIGADVVPSVIESNSKFADDRRTFVLHDAVNEQLPEADVVLCREVLFHLSLEDALSVLRTILRSERSYLVATTDARTLFNGDIETGDFRLLNLEKRPFRFPPPLRTLPDEWMSEGRRLGVWQIESIRSALGGST